MPTHKYKIVTEKSKEEIQAIVDAIKAIKIDEKPVATAATAFHVDRSLLRRYIAKCEAAELNFSTTTNDQLVAFIADGISTTGGKTVCSSNE